MSPSRSAAPSAQPPAREEAGTWETAGGPPQRAGVRDVLAWMRLLVDPGDASAVVRALARPPVELRQTDLARVIQLARRRKLDLVLGLAAAMESPQVPPEARERIQRFLDLHRAAAAELDALDPGVFVARLIDRLEGRAVTVAERAHTAAAQPDSQLASALELLRAEVLAGVGRIGGRLGELRLDTELDVSHGVVRYLELLKLSALLQRPDRGGDLEVALADINARLLAATTPLEREIFQTSTLDRTLGTALRDTHDAHGSSAGHKLAIADAIAPRDEHSLTPFLPRKGAGLALSASDIQTYRSCPLRYKFARVLRIPAEQTVGQRFGIVVHQALERYHSEGATTLAQLHELLDACWRRSGLGDSEPASELHDKALAALTRYHERLAQQRSQPMWFERPFSFRVGPHHLRGRVDRVDRLRQPSDQRPSSDDRPPAAHQLELAGTAHTTDDAEYELIDYKTGHPRSAAELKDDIQLSLYALAAREDWGLASSSQAYYYVLDDALVPVPSRERSADTVKDVVLEVGDGIMSEEFAPTPSRAACSLCDYRIVCPVAET